MMTRIAVRWVPVMGALLAGIAYADVTAVANFRAPAERAVEHVPGFLWLEAEGFADYGNWKCDTQFTHKMGSAYLLAPGVTRPIGSATTTVSVPRAGRWQAWARTKDWVPEFHPGRFRLVVAGKTGPVLGSSGQSGWHWEKAGAFDLAAGEATMALEDLSGAFARCDAILLTTDSNYVPPEEALALEAERMRLTGCDPSVADGGAYDVVVVGAGPGGCGAAIAAARSGARTLLVHDRPVLGGNAGAEFAVGMNGAGCPFSGYRETGIVEEGCLLSLKGTEPGQHQSHGYAVMAAGETNLTVVGNVRILSAATRDGQILSVMGRNTLTGRRTSWRGKMFVDATGDGWLGYFAGAKMLTGREGQARFGEKQAPEQPDNLTMSGCIMDNGCCAYRALPTSAPVAYEVPVWARILPPGFTREVQQLASGKWWMEHGGEIDDMADPELARDTLVRYSFAYWGWLKNESHLKERARNYALAHVPWRNARREGMRIEGDYIFTANDALNGTRFDDRVTITGWPLDTHDPLGLGNPTGNGYWHPHPGLPAPCDVPYRILYSKNVANLFMAGRCVSTSHIGLGTLRVQSTCCSMGQVVGTAAAECIRLGLSPRDYGKRHIKELQQRLLKDDVYIQDLVNADPADLARQARITASSSETLEFYDRNDLLVSREPRDLHALTMPRGVRIQRGASKRLEAFDAWLVNTTDKPLSVTLRIYSAEEPAWAVDAAPVACVTSTVPARKDGLVRFSLNGLSLNQKYFWAVIMPQKGLAWRMAPESSAHVVRAWFGAGVTNPSVRPNQYAFCTEPALAWELGAAGTPTNVVDGVARRVDGLLHGWVSDGAQGLPAWIRLDWDAPQMLSELRLTFDSDLSSKHPVLPRPKTLVRRYQVDVSPDGTNWCSLVTEDANLVRHRIHRFAPRMVKAVRVTVLETYGDVSARIFEIRAY
ncbi:MAG: FAD-dependent oxidoreductase [Kiritimatiellae bacterium]|nr:FAD-dependent oxidoreductase [Kiritimatiellia bacterium]